MADPTRPQQHKPGNTPQMKLHPDYTPIRPAPAAAAPPAAESVPVERGVVARGRCVETPDPDAALIKMHSSTPNGINESTRRPTIRHMPGDTVLLHRREIARLRELGFLVDPDRVDSVAMPLQQAQHSVGPVESQSPAKA